MDKEKKWCVYIHTSPSNKYYVGITSQKPERRWRNGYGYASNKYFSNAINKYGWSNFKHEIIYSNLTEGEAKNYEMLLISKLQSNNPKFGYNISSGGENGMRELKGTPVCQFNMRMELIAEYRSSKEAAWATGVSASTILNCCNLKYGYKTGGGYIWIFKHKLKDIDFDEYKAKIYYEKSLKSVIQFTLSMEFVNEYESISQASKLTGIQFSDISMVLAGKLKQAGGYIWISKAELNTMPFEEIKTQREYKNSRCRPVYQFSLDGQLIQEFKSVTDASRNTKIALPNIYAACRSKTHKSQGFIWWFKDDYEKEVA